MRKLNYDLICLKRKMEQEQIDKIKEEIIQEDI